MADDQIKAPHGGVDGIVEMLHVMAEPDRQRLLKDIAARDPRLFAELQAKLFTFADLIALEAREMQALIPAVPSARLALALRQADELLKQHFFGNMTRRAAESLQEEMRTSGPRRLSDVEAAQTEVIAVAKELEGRGKLLLRRKPRDPG
jgi:flagellar motor switch protein FliG